MLTDADTNGLRMTDERIAAAKARCEATTPLLYIEHCDGTCMIADMAGVELAWADNATIAERICRAHTDLPDAIADLQALREENTKLRAVAEAAVKDLAVSGCPCDLDRREYGECHEEICHCHDLYAVLHAAELLGEVGSD